MRILVLIKNMKKLSTIALFIFGVLVTAILTAGLVFYQNNKSNLNNQSSVSSDTLVKSTLDKVNPSNGTLTLSMTEITKHNKQTDCWMLISGKVYDVTSFFGSHPGGNSTMAATCGTDATAAYMTQDPNATSGGSRSAHSGKAKSMLDNYYIGDLNQTIGQQAVTNTKAVPAPVTTSKSTRSNDDEYDD